MYYIFKNSLSFSILHTIISKLFVRISEQAMNLKKISISSLTSGLGVPKLLKTNNYFSTFNWSQRTEILQIIPFGLFQYLFRLMLFPNSSQILLTQWISSKDIIFSVFNPSKAKLLVSSQRIYFSHL